MRGNPWINIYKKFKVTKKTSRRQFAENIDFQTSEKNLILKSYKGFLYIIK